MDEKRAFGVVSAIGKRVGDAARESGGAEPIDRVRAAPDVDALLAIARESGLPAALLDDFAAWAAAQPFAKLRAQVVLQAKMHAAGGRPAPGHEAGRGTVSGKK